MPVGEAVPVMLGDVGGPRGGLPAGGAEDRLSVFRIVAVVAGPSAHAIMTYGSSTHETSQDRRADASRTP